MVMRLVDILHGLDDLKKHALATTLGVLTAFSQAPYDFFPINWLTFPILVCLIDSTCFGVESSQKVKLRKVLTVGWCFGFGYFLNGFWWASLSFFVEPEIFGWMAPLAIIFATAFFALFWALATLVAGYVWRPGWRRILVFTVAMSAAEYLRAKILPGFPWNGPGHAFLEFWVLAQSAAVVGLYGLNFLAFFVFSAPAALLDKFNSVRSSGIRLNVVAVFVLALMTLFGFHQVRFAESGLDTGVKMRIVQPNIPQQDKWAYENRGEIIHKLVEMSGSNLDPETSVVIWPESAFPFLMTQEKGDEIEFTKNIAGRSYLIAGAVRRQKQEVDPNYFNSVYVIDPDGVVRDIYDKVTLMPFGEYLPLTSTLSYFGLENLARSFGGLSSGVTRRSLSIPNVPKSSPLICFEIIFPNSVLTEEGNAQWIVNITNDAWFGNSPGPYQHFAQSRLRAIEEGIPVVRSANTGISGIIDAFGRVVKRLEVGETGSIDGILPSSNSTSQFAWIRRYAHILLALVAICIVVTGRRTLNSGKV